jgi:hypothetical protein
MEKHERLGLGGERIVYPDSNHPQQRVRKEMCNGGKESENSVRAKFYLTKILHVLLPKKYS